MIIEGEDIEVDKSIVEDFFEFLVYLICNVFDYGIELFDICCE